MPGELENISKKMRELVDGMKSSFQKASANISGHIGEVMSDEIKMTTETIKSVGASAKESSIKILKFFGTGWTLELKSFAVDKKQLDVLEDIKKQGQEEKISRLTRFKKTKGAKFLAALFDFLGIPLAILAAGIGAVIGQILIPFKAIWKIAKTLLGPLFKLFDWLSKGKIGGLVKAVIKNKFFLWLAKLFRFFLKLPGLRVIAYGLKLGFTKLLWPLQILLSAFDFIEGYMNTEGSIMDKIKAGIKNMIMKFVKWPVHVIGKFIDWLFGMKKGTTEKTMLKGIEKYIDLFFKYFGLIFKPIGIALSWLVDLLQKTTWQDVKDTIVKIRTWLSELPFKLFDWLAEVYNAGVEMARPFIGDWLAEKMRIKGTPEEEKKRGEDLTAKNLKKLEESVAIEKQMADNIKKIADQGGMATAAPMVAPPPKPLPIVNQSEDAALNQYNYGGMSSTTYSDRRLKTDIKYLR